MNALALDIGTKTGFALSVAGLTTSVGTWTLSSTKAITFDKQCRLDRRLDPRIPCLYAAIKNTHFTHPLDWLFFEDVQFSVTTGQVQLWSSLRAAVWLAAFHLKIQIDCCPVGTLKKFGSGYGASSKSGMAYALTKTDPRFKLEGKKVRDTETNQLLDDNAVDAIHLLKWSLDLTKNVTK